jgi:hypothetical protein
MLKLALPLLVPGIAANNANNTFAPHHFAVFAEFFDGCTDFHISSQFFSDDAAFRQIKRRHLDSYFIAGIDTSESHPHLSRQMR